MLRQSGDIHPGVVEVCDDLDNDCDELIDDLDDEAEAQALAWDAGLMDGSSPPLSLSQMQDMLRKYYVGDGNPERQASGAFTINRLAHRAGEENDADLLMKGFPYDRHWELCKRIGMSHAPAEELETIERLKRTGK